MREDMAQRDRGARLFAGQPWCFERAGKRRVQKELSFAGKQHRAIGLDRQAERANLEQRVFGDGLIAVGVGDAIAFLEDDLAVGDDDECQPRHVEFLHALVDEVVERTRHFVVGPVHHAGFDVVDIGESGMWCKAYRQQKEQTGSKSGLTRALNLAYGYGFTPTGALMSVSGEKRGR